MAEVRLLSEDPDAKGVYGRFGPHLRPYRGRIALALATTALSTAAVVGIAPVIGADGARIAAVEVAAGRTDLHGLRCGAQRLHQGIEQRFLALDKRERDAPRRPRTEARQLRELAYQRLDFGAGHNVQP